MGVETTQVTEWIHVISSTCDKVFQALEILMPCPYTTHLRDYPTARENERCIRDSQVPTCYSIFLDELLRFCGLSG
jgi:hypothetical protein